MTNKTIFILETPDSTDFQIILKKLKSLGMAADYYTDVNDEFVNIIKKILDDPDPEENMVAQCDDCSAYISIQSLLEYAG